MSRAEIPFHDLRLHYEAIRDEVARVLACGWYVLGVEAAEAIIARGTT